MVPSILKWESGVHTRSSQTDAITFLPSVPPQLSEEPGRWRKGSLSCVVAQEGSGAGCFHFFW